jgi:methionine sulfoxide reductase heme-binding subunit
MSFFWVTTRAAGSVALVASSVSVCVGLILSGRLIQGRRNDLRAAHEALSLATLAALVVHVLSLLADSFFHPTILDVTIPFVSGYKQPWMSIGIVSGWALAILGLTYYARARIGQERWRRLHRWTALAWLGGLVHAIGIGTDNGRMWFLAMAGIVAVPAIALLIQRFSGTSQDSLTAR